MKKNTKLTIILGTLFLSSCSFTRYSSKSSSSEEVTTTNVVTTKTDSVTSSSETTSSEETSTESSIESSESSNESSTSSSNIESSTESSESSSSSNKESSIESSSSSRPEINEDGYYRIEPVQSNEPYFNVYNLDGTIEKTIKKSVESDSSTWYIDPMDVALYYQAYRETPINYCFNDRGQEGSTSQEHFNKYGKYARFFSKDYFRTDGYMQSIPTPHEYRYFEIDISNGNDGYSYKSRKTKRLVVVYNGLTQYKKKHPVIFYTSNHYSSFFEVTNYARKFASSPSLSWIGNEFDGEKTGFGDYIKPETISI